MTGTHSSSKASASVTTSARRVGFERTFSQRRSVTSANNFHPKSRVRAVRPKGLSCWATLALRSPTNRLAVFAALVPNLNFATLALFFLRHHGRICWGDIAHTKRLGRRLKPLREIFKETSSPQ